MDAKKIDELFKIDRVKYRLPIYQRRYVWDEKNWEHLWKDLTSIIKDKYERSLKVQDHFTGVIVTRAKEDRKIEIVDGQQRLTTFQIILCAIRDACKNTYGSIGLFEQIADRADERIRNSTGNVESLELYKLLPTEGADLKAFRSLVGEKQEESNGLIKKAYNHFKKEIVTYVRGDAEKMRRLYRSILFDFSVVQIELTEGDEASKIFESLNGRGRTLVQFDHLRNNIFLRAGEIGVGNQLQLYEKHWLNFNKDDYWQPDKVVEAFLRDFLKVKLGNDFNDQDSLFDLYQWNYRSKLREKLKCREEDRKFIEHEFQELERYSNVYKKINEKKISNYDQEDRIWFYKFLSKEFKITNWHPLILLLESEKQELNISNKDLDTVFRVLESYLIRCMLCHGSESIRRENDLISLIRVQGFSIEKIIEYLESGQIIKRWPTDKRVRSALREAGNRKLHPRRLIQYILFQIEHEITDSTYSETSLKFSEWLTIEHVMPQKWEQKKLPLNEQNWPLSPTPQYHAEARKRDKLLQSIGNLTLLKNTLNNVIGNESFSVKKEAYKEHSKLSLTHDIIWMPPNNQGKSIERSTWNARAIRKRETKLTNLFYKIWPSAESFQKDYTVRSQNPSS